MVVTIFNHAEHGAHNRVPAALLSQASAQFKEEKSRRASRLAHARIRAHRRHENSILAGRPAVLAWFSDHKPPFGNALQLRDRIRSVQTPPGSCPRMQTWYQVNSKCPCPGLFAAAAGRRVRQGCSRRHPARLDNWLAANVTAREECAGFRRAPGRPGAKPVLPLEDLGAFPLH
jgi:hypothetical protein